MWPPLRARPWVVGVTCLAAWTLAAPDAGAAPPATQLLRLDNGIDVWISEVPGAPLAAVHLELDAGPTTEDAGAEGRAAAVLGALLGAGVGGATPGELRVELREAGWVETPALAGRILALTGTGPPGSLEAAVRATARRLRRAPAGAIRGADIRAALWEGAEDVRRAAVAREGTVADIARVDLFGDPAARSSFTSRLMAGARDDADLARLATDGLAQAGARLVVTVPSGQAADAARLVRDHLAPLPARPRPGSSAPAERVRPREARRGRALNLVDGRRLSAVAWDLRGAARGAGLDRPGSDAALLALSELLDHPGGPLHQRLVGGHLAARQVDVEIAFDDIASLVVVVEVRGPDAADARRLVAEEVERFAARAPTAAAVRGAATLAAVGLRHQWSSASRRAALLANLAASGRVRQAPDAEAWFAATTRALAQVDPEAVQRLATWGFTDGRRAMIDVEPSEPPPEERVTLDRETLDTWLRIQVSVSCPVSDDAPDADEEIGQRFGWDTARYLAVKRALSRLPRKLDELEREVRERCLEFAKLRSLASLADAVALHRAIACEAGRLADPTRREAALAKIFRRVDLDRSVYRPLIRMAREDRPTASRLEAIDRECAPAHGPAAPR